MAIVYVASTGANAGAGTTTGAPWLTLAYALANTTAGDTINLNGGDTFTENAAVTSGRTIQSYGTGRATVAGGTSSAITATNCDGVTVNNLTLTMTSVANTTANPLGVVHFSSTTATRYTAGVAVTNCDISGGPAGITMQGSATAATPGGWSGVTITGNAIHDCPQFGVFLYEAGQTAVNRHFSNVTISGNHVYSIIGDTSTNTTTGNGIALGNADASASTAATQTNAGTCAIRLNRVRLCGKSSNNATSGATGVLVFNCDAVTVEKNVIYDTYATTAVTPVGGHAIEVSTGATNTLVQFNYAYGCEGAGLNFVSLGAGNVVRFNVFAGVANRVLANYAGIRLIQTGAATFHNNTVTSTGPNPALYAANTGATTNKALYNNLFTSRLGTTTLALPALDASFKLEGNAYISGAGSFSATVNSTAYTSLSALQAGVTTVETSGHGFALAASPFVSFGRQPFQALTDPTTLSSLASYSLLPTSPLVNGGLDLSSLYSVNPGTVDIVGGTLGSPYSVGAVNAAGTAPTYTTWESTVLADSPVAWWRLNEASGQLDVFEATGYAASGQQANVTLGAASIQAGDTNTAATFNGTSSIVRQTVAAIPLTAATVITTIKPVATASINTAILGNWGATGPLQNFLLQQVGTEIQVAFRGDGNSNFLIGTTTNAGMAAGSSYHVAVVWGGSTSFLVYVNGVSKTVNLTNTQAVLPKIQTSWFFGAASTAPSTWWGGTIDDTILYPTALNSTRITANYNASTTAPSALAAGTASTSSTGSTVATVTCTAATGGTAPYTYQWYRSTTSGFTPPGAGTAVSGATSLTLNDTGLTNGTTYYYKLIATDAVAATATSNQVSATPASSNATGYTLAASPGTVATGSPSTITATISGGTSLSSPLVVTLLDNLAGAVSGTITINNGSTTGTATVTPSVAGTHAITATHTGGGFTGGDGSTTFAATAAGQVVYVAAGGSDAAGGTIGSPLATLGYALSSTGANPTINLRGGDTFSENVTVSKACTIQSYNTGRATVAGGSSPAITIANCDGVTLDNLALTMSSTANATASYIGVLNLSSTTATRYTAGITISNCDISGGPSGITARASNTASTPGGWNGLTITGNTVHDCPEFGIYLHEVSSNAVNRHYSNVLISGNHVYNIAGNGNASGGASGCGVVLANSDSTASTAATQANAGQCVIRLNHIHDCGRSATQAAGPAGIFPINSDGVLVEKNVVHDLYASTVGADGAGIDLDINAANCTVQYNYVYNCEGPGLLLYTSGNGNLIRFNAFVNTSTRQNAASGAFRAPFTGSCTVYNNTFLGTGPYAALQITSGMTANKKFYNNVFISRGKQPILSLPALDATFVLEGNAYMAGPGEFSATINGTTYTSLAAMQAAVTTVETSGHGFALAADPFAAYPRNPVQPLTDPTALSTLANIRLVAGNPLVGAGLNLSSLYSITPGSADLIGGTITPPYSVGAANAATAAPGLTGWETAVLADAPAYWWRLDEPAGSTVVADNAGGGLGIPSNVTLGATSLFAGDAGTGATFNGTSSIVRSNFGSLPLSAATLAVMFKPLATSGVNAPILGNWGSTGASQNMLLQQVGAELTFSLRGDGTAVFLTGTTTNAGLVAGTPYLVEVVWGGAGSFLVYVNGVSKTVNLTATGTPAPRIQTTWFFGAASTSPSAFWGGTIDEAILYPTALSPTRVAAHYAAAITAPSGVFRRVGLGGGFRQLAGGFRD